jgi:hypothetical protein
MTEMREIDHTHPHTDEPFGQVHDLGAVVADGGTPESTEDATETMEDVEHESAEGTNRTFERGTEGRTDTV